MVIDEKQCMDTILKIVPEFKTQWNEYLEYWENKTPGVCTDLSEFADFIKNNINILSDKKLNEIFDWIEKLMLEGNETVSTAAATCFIEDLSNLSGTYKEVLKFVRYLRPESKAYCKAWDEFTGAKTPGLWEEGEEFRSSKRK